MRTLGGGWVVVGLLLLSGCGGGDGGKPQPSGPPPKLTIPAGPFAEMQVACATVSGATLGAPTYAANLDGIPVTLARVSTSEVCWLVPTLADGTHTLRVSFSATPTEATIETRKTPPPVSLDQILAAMLPGLRTRLQDLIATLRSDPANAGAVVELEQRLADLDALPALVARLSTAERVQLTALFYQNLLTSNRVVVGKAAERAALPGLVHTQYDAVRCLGARQDVLGAWKPVERDIALIVLSALAGLALPPPAGVPVSLIAIGILVAQLVDDFAQYRVMRVLENRDCSDPDDEIAPLPPAAATLARIRAATPLSFAVGVPKVVGLSTRYALADPDAISSAEMARARIAELPSWVLSASARTALDVPSTVTDVSPPLPYSGTYAVSAVSDARITGIAATSPANTLQLTFSFSGAVPVDGVVFSFTLRDSRDGHAKTFPATLAGPVQTWGGTWRWTACPSAFTCSLTDDNTNLLLSFSRAGTSIAGSAFSNVPTTLVGSFDGASMSYTVHYSGRTDVVDQCVATVAGTLLVGQCNSNYVTGPGAYSIRATLAAP